MADQVATLKQTALNAEHRHAGAKLVDFAGWEMPIHYGSQVEEHHHVRQCAGMFDVSHMVVVDFKGPDVEKFLQYVLANDVSKLTLGKALYSCMLNEAGGIIDDLIVYKLAQDYFRLVVNAGRRDADLTWLAQQAHGFQFTRTVRDDLAILAVQGPLAREKVVQCFPEHVSQLLAIGIFKAYQLDDYLFARTGYTGEDGFEIILPNNKVTVLWQQLLALEVKPCGLGARDTLRLEAGMNLYGCDMTETTSPLESGLGWTIAWQPETRNFIGRAALTQQKAAGTQQTLVGLVLEGRGVLRNHQQVIMAHGGEGEITSGSFSPTLEIAIALARVPKPTAATCQVLIRDKLHTARIVKIPFVRHGKQVYQPI